MQKRKNKFLPVATISSTVQVQEQTFQAFLNWLRIAPDFLWHSSPGRNAEGNLHTLPEVSPQGTERRYEHGGQHLSYFFFCLFVFVQKEITEPEKKFYILSLSLLNMIVLHFQKARAESQLETGA